MNLNLRKKRFKLDDRKGCPTQKVIGLQCRLPREIVQDTVIRECNTGTKQHQETHSISVWSGFTLIMPVAQMRQRCDFSY